MSEQSQKPSDELSEDELSAVAGGTEPSPKVSINSIAFGVQKDKMQSANKQADAIRKLL